MNDSQTPRNSDSVTDSKCCDSDHESQASDINTEPRCQGESVSNDSDTESVEDSDNPINTQVADQRANKFEGIASTCNGPVWDSLCSTSMMLVFAVVGYLLLPLLPNPVRSGTSGTESKSNVPSDGPDTIYRPVAPAQPFFPEDSFVFDSYRGELHFAGQAVEDYGYVFVMYYASWSARSMLARDEFSEAARIMYPRVPFIAINCWYPKSQCTSKYKFYNFPSFYVYASGMELGFTYTGIEKAHYFVRFIQSLLNPITHISNSSQLINFVSTQESSLVGYFNLSEPEPEGRFQQFYYASLRSIEKDFIQPVKFGVLSDLEFASQFRMDDVSPLLLVRSIKENLVYPSANNFTSSAITKWVNTNKLKPVVKWKFPHGKKSKELYTTLESGPTVLLLTEYTACSQYNNHVSLLREMIMDYYTCNTSVQGVKDKVNLMIAASLKRRQAKGSQDTPLCLLCHDNDVWSEEVMLENEDTCCYSVSDQQSVCQMCIPQVPCSGHCEVCRQINPTRLTAAKSNNLSCHSVNQSKLLYSRSGQANQVCCKAHTSHRRYTDSYVYEHNTCTPLPYAKHSPESECLANIRLPENSTLCHSNSTPNFIAMDSKLYREISVRLSPLGLYNQSHYPQLVLIDLKSDSHYVMRGAFSKQNILSFLTGFTRGDLSRDHITSLPTSQYTDDVVIQSVTSRQLVYIIEHPRRGDVLVYFYTKWCLHCKAVHHMFLSVAKYLRRFTTIKLLRFDVSTQTLPWKYALSQVPTISLITKSDNIEKLTPTASIRKLLMRIVHYMSSKHLVELVTSIKRPPSYDTIERLRSRMTQLQIKLQGYYLLYTPNSHHTLNDNAASEGISLQSVLHRNLRSIRSQLLNLRKVYRLIYSNTYHYPHRRRRLILRLDFNDSQSIDDR